MTRPAITWNTDVPERVSRWRVVGTYEWNEGSGNLTLPMLPDGTQIEIWHGARWPGQTEVLWRDSRTLVTIRNTPSAVGGTWREEPDSSSMEGPWVEDR